MGNRNIFWHVKEPVVDRVTLVEHTLKYGDFDDILNLFKKMDRDEIKKIWLDTMAWDNRFLKINLMTARIFFKMDVEKEYFIGLKNGRFKTRVFVR